MNSNANDRYGSSLERPLGAGKPVDPATRLSELLAQSLEELTRPFDPPRPGAPAPTPFRAVPEEALVAAQRSEAMPEPQQSHEPASAEPEVKVPSEESSLDAEDSRVDADRALAELEAELFAAAKQVDREHADAADNDDEHHPEDLDRTPPRLAAAVLPQHDGDVTSPADFIASTRPARAEATAVPDADAAGVIAKVRRLMLVSMAITVIAVGSVFGLIGYRMYKGDGAAAKTADKLPESSPISTDVTLTLPRGARVVQSAVANDRLVMTLEIDGKLEVRTFDLKTLQPTGRLNFSATP
jgi:hypothetical protein